MKNPATILTIFVALTVLAMAGPVGARGKTPFPKHTGDDCVRLWDAEQSCEFKDAMSLLNDREQFLEVCRTLKPSFEARIDCANKNDNCMTYTRCIAKSYDHLSEKHPLYPRETDK